MHVAMAGEGAQRTSCLLELPDSVLHSILQRLPRRSRIAMYQTCHSLRSSSSMASFLKSDMLVQGRCPFSISCKAFLTWPQPVHHLKQLIMSIDLRSDQLRRSLHRMLKDCWAQPRAKALLSGVTILDIQGLCCPEKHMNRLVAALSSLLQLCPKLEKLLLPQVPAHCLQRLLVFIPQHSNITSLTVLSWMSDDHTQGQQVHTAAMLSSITQLTSLDFTLLGCNTVPDALPARAGAEAYPPEAEERAPLLHPGTTAAPVADLTPLASLTSLASLSLHLRANSGGGHYNSAVVATGIYDIASRCTNLQRLELRSRIRANPLDTPPESKVLWPSLRHALLHESAVPEDAASLLIHKAPHPACVEVPQGIDVPITPRTTPLDILSTADHMLQLATCLSRCTVPTTELRMHHIVTQDSSHPYHSTPYMYQDFDDSWTHDYECAPIMAAMAPLAPKLLSLHLSGSFLSTSAAVTALGAALPELQLLSVTSAAACTALALSHGASAFPRIHKLELFIGKGSLDIVDAITDMLASFQHARHKQACSNKTGSSSSGSGNKPAAALRVLLISCGWEGSQAVPTCASAWHELVSKAGWAGSDLHVELMCDHLPDL